MRRLVDRWRKLLVAGPRTGLSSAKHSLRSVAPDPVSWSATSQIAMRNIPFVLAFLLFSCAAHRVGFAPPQRDNADGSTPAWVDLRPGMELRIAGAYFREGSSQHDVADYLGAQSVTYEVGTDGELRAGAVSSFLKEHRDEKQPADQPAIQTLIPPRNLRYRYHRLFFQLAMSRTGATHPAVLIGSGSIIQLDKVTTAFLLAQSVCGPRPSAQCTTFPAFCTASLGIEIVVNGVARKVIWGSTLGSVAGHPHSVELVRNANGRLASVPINVADPETLRLPLLHGDRLNWN
jgi:hypothetical protein